MCPKVANVHLAGDADFGEIDRHSGSVVATVEQCEYIIAIGHLSIPYLVFLVAEFVAKRFAYKAIAIESEQFIVGVILGM